MRRGDIALTRLPFFSFFLITLYFGKQQQKCCHEARLPLFCVVCSRYIGNVAAATVYCYVYTYTFVRMKFIQSVRRNFFISFQYNTKHNSKPKYYSVHSIA